MRRPAALRDEAGLGEHREIGVCPEHHAQQRLGAVAARCEPAAQSADQEVVSVVDSPDPVNHVFPAWDFLCGQQAALGVVAVADARLAPSA